MLEKNQKDKLIVIKEEDTSLVDFFDLLLKVDKRNNPHLYEIEEKYD